MGRVDDAEKRGSDYEEYKVRLQVRASPPPSPLLISYRPLPEKIRSIFWMEIGLMSLNFLSL